jgi:ABC-type sugar transport system permease subunit
MSKKTRDTLVGYSFIGIWIIGFLVFMLIPVVNSVIYSFSVVKIESTGIKITPNGTKNFLNIFQAPEGLAFTEALLGFAKELIVQVPIIIVFSIIIAILLNQPIKCRGLFRAVFFLPVIISSGPVINELATQGAGGASLMSSMGFTTMLEDLLGPTLAEPITGLFSDIIIIFWFSGVQILIMLAGIQKMDKQVYEAAHVDGAGSWEIFWKITLPSLKALIFVSTIYTIVLLSTFSNNEVIVQIKNNMFATDANFGYGFASAMSWIYMLVMALFIILVCVVLLPRDKKRGAK